MLDPFTSNQVSLTYDNNGNLTDDGVLRYVYDAWNRLRKVNRYADGDTTIIAEYKYLGDTRRASKMVQKCGIEYVANDGGNTTVHFYYGSQSPDREGGVAWRIFETRNGSNQSTRQWLWGTQYIDEPVCMDVNSSPTHSSDCDPDTSDPGGGTDRRYFYHQDRNFNVVALIETDDGAGTAGRIAERYAYTPYGEFVVLKGETSSGNLGNALPTSTVGNPLAHQGLVWDAEVAAYVRPPSTPPHPTAQPRPQPGKDIRACTALCLRICKGEPRCFFACLLACMMLQTEHQAPFERDGMPSFRVTLRARDLMRIPGPPEMMRAGPPGSGCAPIRIGEGRTYPSYAVCQRNHYCPPGQWQFCTETPTGAHGQCGYCPPGNCPPQQTCLYTEKTRSFAGPGSTTTLKYQTCDCAIWR